MLPTTCGGSSPNDRPTEPPIDDCVDDSIQKGYAVDLNQDEIVVGIVMGSDSDWPVMSAAAEALDEFGIGYEVDVVSAHRMPTEMIDYGRTAATRGLQVIIAGAGGAAHLPGMLASVTPLPVIGVPVPLSHLDGMDSLLSIVQMPVGIPVGTLAIGSAGAGNAALLAIAILGNKYPQYRTALQEYRRWQTETVLGQKLPATTSS